MSVAGFVGWRATLTPPSEESLELIEGRVVSSQEKTSSRRGSTVRFQISGHQEEWRYTDSYPNYDKARFRLIPGARVRLWALPQHDFWRPRIWRMEVSGSTIVTFQMMESDSRRNGRWGLAVSIASLLVSAYLGWDSWNHSRTRLRFERWKRKRRRRMRQLRERPLQAPK